MLFYVPFFNCEALPKYIFFDTENSESQEKDASQMTLKLYITSIQNIPSLIGIFGGNSYIIQHTKIIRIFTPQVGSNIPPFVKLVLPYVSMQYYHDPNEVQNSQPLLLKTIEKMMQSLKPKIVSSKQANQKSQQIIITDSNKIIGEVHSNKSKIYAEWSSIIEQLIDKRDGILSVPHQFKLEWEGEGDKKQLEQCILDINNQIKEEITKDLKTSRATRNIDSEVKSLDAKRRRHLQAWEATLLNDMVG